MASILVVSKIDKYDWPEIGPEFPGGQGKMKNMITFHCL